MRSYVSCALIVFIFATSLCYVVVRQLLPHLRFIPQTVYYHAIDDRHAFRVYTDYTARNGVEVYCEALYGGQRICGIYLCRHNKPFDDLVFQTIVSEDSMAVLVPSKNPFIILLLVDLKTLETSEQGDREHGDAWRPRRARMLERFRASTKEPRYEL